MDRPLEIVGELSLEFEGGRALIRCLGDSVDVRLPDARSALALFRQGAPATRRDGLRRADAEFRRAGLVARVLVGDRTVARLGGDATPGPLSRALRIDPMALSLVDVLLSAFGLRGRDGVEAGSTADRP